MAVERFRVLKMEPLVGSDRPDERTAPAPGTAGSSPGPDMQAARGLEGQTVTLGQLEGMGRLDWESDQVARLDTANESYRLSLQPLDANGPARVQEEAAEIERARASTPSGTGQPWLRWLVIALVLLFLVAVGLAFSGTMFR